jgi:uncharacterized small protein (DUF1192 family)
MRLPDAVEWHQAELFLQVGADPDENSACAIELTAVVVTELQDPSQLTEAPHTFFWRRTYNVETKEISALPSAPGGPAAGDSGATPMDTDSAAGPPAPAAPAPARRNDTRQRVLALEERVSAQNEQIALMQSHIARLEAKMDLLIASGA